MIYRLLFTTFLAALCSSSYAGHHDEKPIDPNIAKIANDFEGIADVMQVPLVQKSEVALIANTRDDVIALYKDMKANIQEGYKYSTVDSLEISRVIDSIYSVEAFITRYNEQDEVVGRAQAIYFLNNHEGPWKMFYMQFFSL